MAWTAEQQLAIDTRDRTLLVSAAAGSGKTATLTERIIQSILDEENPADIGRMLIATFTNAAVEELRTRIAKKVGEAAKANPGNARLEEQLLRIKDAKILTITSFCNSVLRSCAEAAGLPPNYRIAEPSEAKIIASSILESLIDMAYEGELPEVCTSEEFIALGDSLASVKHGEELREAIETVFEKLKSTERGIDTLLPLIDEYNPERFTSVENTRIGKHIIDYADGAFADYLDAFSRIMPSATDAKPDVKNMKAASSDTLFLESFIQKKGYLAKREALSLFDSGTIAHPKPEDACEFAEGVEFLHENLKEEIATLKAKFFLYSEQEWLELYIKLYKMLGVFYRFIKRYYNDYLEAKRKRGICEFADVERYAYEALYNKDGIVTPLALEIAARYDYIYVDEYQDVNALQSRIFEAISDGKNRFMVGDIKQSIYGFRSARPGIFADMKSAFAPLGKEGDFPLASLFMSNNFRCDKNVVDFVNGIFDRMFGILGDSIGYVPEDKLGFSKIYEKGDTPTGHVPEIHLIEKPYAPTSLPADADEFEDEVMKEEREGADLQAKAIVDKICELLSEGRLASGKRPEPRDIAVLFRSVKSECASRVSERLAAKGIAANFVDVGNLFLDESVLLALSMLYTIDNPRRDIYLASLMCSPLYDFSADELMEIRAGSDSETLWEALGEYLDAHPDYAKGKSFMTSVLRYRSLASGLATDELISLIYRESGLMALAARNGGRENLILLLSHARSFERSDFKGLYSFISFINDVIEGGEEFGAPDTSCEANAVNLMTVHKSKGLEFPICILANAASRGRNNTDKISFSEDFGIAFKLKDDTGLALVENPAVHAINHFIKKNEYDEEQRVLYVALTRAREMLYVYGVCPQKDTDKYLSKIEKLRAFPTKYFTAKAKTLFDMVLVGRDCGRLVLHAPDAFEEQTAEAKDGAALADGQYAAEPEGRVGYSERFSFVYPHRELETLPEKISVSKLSPTVLDGTEDEGSTLDELLVLEGIKAPTDADLSECDTPDGESDGERGYLPKFITGKDDSEGARRGIATHSVMQFADFARLEKDGVSSELERLVAEEFISEADAKLVRKKEIEAFVRSDLFREIAGAKKLYRELRFNIKLPARDFTENEEKRAALKDSEVFVQGVIDCVIEDELGRLHLIDYKTDRVSYGDREIPGRAEQKLLDTHRRQLTYYSRAVEAMFGKAPERIGIYSLHLGCEIEVPTES